MRGDATPTTARARTVRARLLVSPAARLACIYLGPLGVETIYLGSRKSPAQIRVYDKRQQLKDSGRAVEGRTPWTRFEAQLEPPKVGLHGLADLGNPYAGLRLFALRPDGLSLPRRVLVAHARMFGLPALKPELAPEEFAALLHDLEVSDGVPVVPHPKEVFASRWSDAALRFLSKLGLDDGSAVGSRR